MIIDAYSTNNDDSNGHGSSIGVLVSASWTDDTESDDDDDDNGQSVVASTVQRPPLLIRIVLSDRGHQMADSYHETGQFIHSHYNESCR
jgi:hypothetical protein